MYDDTLQAALSAQVRKRPFKHRGALDNDRPGPTQSQESRPRRRESSILLKLTHMSFYMKAKMGIMRRVMINASVNTETAPNQRKPKEQTAIRKQKDKFAVTWPWQLGCSRLIGKGSQMKSLIPMTNLNLNMEEQQS